MLELELNAIRNFYFSKLNCHSRAGGNPEENGFRIKCGMTAG
jgi:hypothetical protein